MFRHHPHAEYVLMRLQAYESNGASSKDKMSAPESPPPPPPANNHRDHVHNEKVHEGSSVRLPPVPRPHVLIDLPELDTNLSVREAMEVARALKEKGNLWFRMGIYHSITLSIYLFMYIYHSINIYI
jgi:hypothetical protein